MSRIGKKLHSQRGETLVEVMAAILVATLSVGLLVGGISVSFKMNEKAKETDGYFYQALTKAESRNTPATKGIAPNPTLRVTEGGRVIGEIPINVYGEKGLYSYSLTPAGGDLP